MGTCSVLSPHERPPADVKPAQSAAARELSATTGAGPRTSEGKPGAEARSWTE